MTQNQQIANTILQQLGGNKFVVMTGAKQLVAIENGLRFRIGRNDSKANMVRIVLKADDTYKMEFIKIGNMTNRYAILQKSKDRDDFLRKLEAAEKRAEPKVLEEYDGIYCDQLEELFSDYTKLATRL